MSNPEISKTHEPEVYVYATAAPAPHHVTAQPAYPATGGHSSPPGRTIMPPQAPVTQQGWRSGEFDCCSNIIPSCCMAFFCPCVMVSEIYTVC